MTTFDNTHQDSLPRFRRQIRSDTTDGQIDHVVYALYALTDDEVRIVTEPAQPS